MLGGLLFSFCKPLDSFEVHVIPVCGREGRSVLPLIPCSTLGGGESPNSLAALPSSEALLAEHSHPATPKGTCSPHMLCFSLVLTCLLFLIKQVFNKLKLLLLASAHFRCKWCCRCSDADVDLRLEPTELN